MAITGKYPGSRIRRWFDERFGKECYLCMRKSYELRISMYEFQKAVEDCLGNLLFFNEKEHRFLEDMESICHTFRYLPEEIGECMRRIEAMDDLEEMLYVANKIGAHANRLGNAIGAITGVDTDIPIILNPAARQIVQKPCGNLLKEMKILYDKVYCFTSEAVPALEAYKQAIDKAEAELLKPVSDLKNTSESDTLEDYHVIKE